MSDERFIVDVGDCPTREDYDDLIEARDDARQDRADARREVEREEWEDRNAWRKLR